MTTPGDGFRVDLDQLDLHARQVADLATAVGHCQPADADIARDAYGLIGGLFAGAATAAMVTGVDAVAARAAHLDGLAGRLGATLEGYRAAEQQHRDRFSAVVLPIRRYT